MKEFIFEYTSIITSILLLVIYTKQMISLLHEKDFTFMESFKTIKVYLSKWYNYFPLLLIPFLFFINLWYIGLIYTFIGSSIFVFLKWKNKHILHSFWKAFRLYILLIILDTILGTILLMTFKLVELTSMLIIVLNINFIVVYLSYWIILPFEKILNASIFTNKE